MTTCTTSSNGAPLHLIGKRPLHTFTAVLVAVLAATSATAFGQGKAERSARVHNRILEIAKREAEKNTIDRTEFKKGLAAF